MDRMPAGLLDEALLFQVLPKLLGVHVVSALVDVHEIRDSAGLGDGFGGGDEGVRDGNGD